MYFHHKWDRWPVRTGEYSWTTSCVVGEAGWGGRGSWTTMQLLEELLSSMRNSEAGMALQIPQIGARKLGFCTLSGYLWALLREM